MKTININTLAVYAFAALAIAGIAFGIIQVIIGNYSHTAAL